MEIKCTNCNNLFTFIDYDDFLEGAATLSPLAYNISREVYCPYCEQYVPLNFKVVVIINEDVTVLSSAQIKEIKDDYYDYGFSAGQEKGYEETRNFEYDKGYDAGLRECRIKIEGLEYEGQEFYKDGLEDGYENGYQEGHMMGYDMGYGDGYIDCKAGRPPQS